MRIKAARRESRAYVFLSEVRNTPSRIYEKYWRPNYLALGSRHLQVRDLDASTAAAAVVAALTSGVPRPNFLPVE